MKITVDIDQDLMRGAMQNGKYRSEKEAIEAGLRLLVLRGQAGIRQLRGKVKWEGDLEESRQGRFGDTDE